MNELQVINEQEILGKQFKIYGTIEKPLFLAKDVAEYLEIKNVSQMLTTVDDDEKVIYNVYTLGGNQNAWFLTEYGLYEILMQSRKPIAKAFKKEVKKILKTLRLNQLQMTDINNSNNTYDSQQINDLITTVNNLASTVNVLLSHMIEKTENKIDFKEEKIGYKYELNFSPSDEIEKEITNTFKTVTTVQDFCKFLNTKKIINKKLGVMIFNQVARDNDIYDDYNYPTKNYKRYFIINYGKLFLTTESMILMYRAIKNQVIEGYIVRR